MIEIKIKEKRKGIDNILLDMYLSEQKTKKIKVSIAHLGVGEVLGKYELLNSNVWEANAQAITANTVLLKTIKGIMIDRTFLYHKDE